jgi:hypothetical protein
MERKKHDLTDWLSRRPRESIQKDGQIAEPKIDHHAAP